MLRIGFTEALPLHPNNISIGRGNPVRHHVTVTVFRYCIMTSMFKIVRLLIVALFLISLTPVYGRESGLGILTYNIHHVEGTDGKIDYQRTAEVIKRLDPDIVALQEVDMKAGRTERVNQVERLAELAGYDYFVFGRSMPFDGGEYGLAIMSRFPILRHETHPLPYRFGLEPRALLITEIDTGEIAGVITVADTHLCHRSEESRIDQVRKINSLLLPMDNPVILAGDFNAVESEDSMRLAWSRGWLDLSHPHSRIDYVLSRESDGAKVISRKMIEDRVTSDHFPILVLLEFPG